MVDNTEALELFEKYCSKARVMLNFQCRKKAPNVRIYMCWTGKDYTTLDNRYHVNILGDGSISFREPDFAVLLSGSPLFKAYGCVTIALCCGGGLPYYNAMPEYPPTKEQIETLVKLIALGSKKLRIPIDNKHVLTRGEAADNEDFEVVYPHQNGYPNNTFGPKSSKKTIDLELLYTPESMKFNPFDEVHRGPSLLRQKAQHIVDMM